MGSVWFVCSIRTIGDAVFTPTIIRKSYWKFIDDEARLMGSDGCTGVSEWHAPCCQEHDLACYFGKNPRTAYTHYCNQPNSPYWSLAEAMTRRQADYMFGKCNLEWSDSKKGKVRSIVRFCGVRIGAFLGIGVRQPKVGVDANKGSKK
jgi:hypothetical protein